MWNKGFIRGYLHSRRAFFLLQLVFFALFCLVFFLYDLPAEPVCYAASLCLTVGIAVVCRDAYCYNRRRRVLQTLLACVESTALALPEPGDALEADYQALLQAICTHRAALAAENSNRYRDLTDYFTLWAHQVKTPIAAMHLLLQAEETPHSRERAALAAENSNRYRDLTDYFTLWAHQVKTPIAAMHLLLQAEETPHSRELSAELFKIEQYVEMVLSYLRLGSDQTDYLFRRCDLDALVRACVRKYARLFILRKISLDFQPTGMTVVTDEKWLSFVIEQLLSNALKYTPVGGRARLFILRKISLDFQPTGMTVVTDEKWLSFVIEQLLSNALKYTPVGGRIRILKDGPCLVIADSGIGIRSEDLPRVFEKGFTGFNGREDKKSTGIGLYLCRQITNRLNHGLTISSRPGAGTRVYLHFYKEPAAAE